MERNLIMKLLRIKEIQETKGLTNAALAAKVNVTPATISNINKESSFPKPELLLKIAEALEVDLREMFNQTKGDAPLNGFVEYGGKIYRIKEKEDLEKLIEKTGRIHVKKENITTVSIPRKPDGLNLG